MRFTKTSALIGAVFAVVLGGTVQAQGVKAPVTAVVDVQRIMHEATAAKDVRSQIEAKRQVLGTQISTEENQLRQAEQELADQRALLSNEAFAKKRQAFQQQVADMQRKVQLSRRQLDQAFVDAMAKIQEVLLRVVAELAAERKVDIVLRKSQVLVFAKTMDLTAPTLERLNAKIKKITIEMPKS